MKPIILSVVCLLLAGLLASPTFSAPPDPSPAPISKLMVDIAVSHESSGLPAGDQRPARVWLDFPKLIHEAGLSGKADLSTLCITQTGEAGEGSSASSSLPFRWDPESLAGDFPSVERTVNGTTGQLSRTFLSHAGLFYNVVEESERGYLVWEASRGVGLGKTADYQLTVIIRAPDSASFSPPRAWIGDGVPRFTRKPPNTSGSSHTRVTTMDWNNDGLNDVLYGEASGRLLVMLNEGTRNKPVFHRAQFVKDENNLSIDAGFTAAPFAVDWDDDGFTDLLVGTHWNRLLFFKNTGKVSDPRFSYEGMVKIGDKPLELPIEPVVGRPSGAFTRDYYPVPSAADWDGDGDLDLIMGGYLTGRIYVFENTEKLADGTPALKALGPLTIDGQPLNVGDWGAAPEFADLTGDGLPDLVTGNLPMTKKSQRRKTPLRFYKNTGTPTHPEFQEESFPSSGPLPKGSLYTPRAADMNGDDLLDLVVSSGSRIYIFPNTGSQSAPMFTANSDFLRTTWGNTPIGATQLIDWNNDGRVDAISDYRVQLNTGAGDPFAFDRAFSVLPKGQEIAHPSGIGDDWFHPRFFDFDHDGDRDVLFGDWHGQVWMHELREDGSYDLDGYILKLESGEPVKVGPKNTAPTENFQALQGARTVFVADDVTDDGKTDLVVGDTFGIVRLFANVGTNTKPVFRETQTLGNLGTRLSLERIDWNDDGLPDIIAGSANGRVQVFVNRKHSNPERQFEKGLDPGLPPIPQPRIIVGDLNGDGDEDLFLPSTQGSVWVERSFLRQGYLEGKVTGVETKPPVEIP